MTELEKAAAAYRGAETAMEDARARLAEAIIAAARANTRQAEIVRVTGYTRETVRRICRSAGVDAS